MKIYKYWSLANRKIGDTRKSISRYGWSNTSIADANAKAEELVEQSAINVLHDNDFPDKYLYSDRPLREEIIENFDDAGETYAVITRNAYGSLVLNTARVLFADIDFPKQKITIANLLQQLMGIFRGFLGPSPTPKETRRDEKQDILLRIKDYVQNSPGLGLRLYHTAAGFRVMVTSQEYDPLDPGSISFLKALGSDPLYVKLCEVQECFRARLTPKFWRCGSSRPPARFPWANETQEQAMQSWIAKYEKRAENYGTCELVDCLGNQKVHSRIAPMVELHDQLCCHVGLPLA